MENTDKYKTITVKGGEEIKINANLDIQYKKLSKEEKEKFSTFTPGDARKFLNKKISESRRKTIIVKGSEEITISAIQFAAYNKLINTGYNLSEVDPEEARMILNKEVMESGQKTIEIKGGKITISGTQATAYKKLPDKKELLKLTPDEAIDFLKEKVMERGHKTIEVKGGKKIDVYSNQFSAYNKLTKKEKERLLKRDPDEAIKFLKQKVNERSYKTITVEGGKEIDVYSRQFTAYNKLPPEDKEKFSEFNPDDAIKFLNLKVRTKNQDNSEKLNFEQDQP